jgi:hypothetical protein
MLADEFAVACLVVVELKAGNAVHQRFQERFALDERQTGCVPPIQMQKIESVVDERHPAFTIARGLGLRKARQSVVANPAQFSVQIGTLRPHIREGSYDARIFVTPIEAGPRQQLHAPALGASGHAEAIKLISWSHCGPEGALPTSWQSWGGIQRGKGDAASGRLLEALPLAASAAERFKLRAIAHAIIPFRRG